ncbi:MAG: PQQ-binding-like beta-propeller repeat protein [bacterium]
MAGKIKHCGVSLSLALLSCGLLLTGCAGHVLKRNVPVYKDEIIQSYAAEQPDCLWQYPPEHSITAAKLNESLNGFARPENSHLIFKGVEPPFIVSMKILSDGSLVIVSPTEMEYRYGTIKLVKSCSEWPADSMIIRLDGLTGKEIWKTSITANGLYEINELGDYLLIQVLNHTIEGVPGETKLILLESRGGRKLCELSVEQLRYYQLVERHGLLVYSFDIQEEKGKGCGVKAVDIKTGLPKPAWKSERHDECTSAIPLEYGDGLLLFGSGVVYRRLPNGEKVWERQDLKFKGGSQPLLVDERLYMQTEKGFMALDAASGKELWVISEVDKHASAIYYTGKHLAVVSYDEKAFWRKKNYPYLYWLNAEDGILLWEFRCKTFIKSGVIEDAGAVLFTTTDRLIALNKEDGSLLFEQSVPWEDEYSPHRISVMDGSIMVVNEWNAAVWKRDGTALRYHHRFEPLWRSITTEKRTEIQKKLGKIETIYPGQPVGTPNPSAALARSQAYYNMQSFNRTGDSQYLKTAQLQLSTAHAVESIEAAGRYVKAWMEFMGTMKNIVRSDIYRLHLMVYPAIDYEIGQFRTYDEMEYVVRLVGLQDGEQRLSCLEVLHLPSGRSKRLMLSPFQGGKHPDDEECYYNTAVYLNHTFRTVVDLPRKRVYHYGPGLKADEYVTYGEGGFVRGKLQAFPFDTP